MLFGVVNSPITFQGYINLVFYKYLNLFYIAYFDDNLIYSKDIKSYTHNVRKVLERLLKHRLFVKLEKCILRVSEISFLGFILPIEGVKRDFLQVSIIMD